MYIATRNESINYLRREKKHQVLQLDALKVELESFDDNPQQLLQSAEIKHEIAGAINELPTQCKIIFKLVREDGLKQKEVAELLDLQPKTVENQLAIAIKKIGLALRKKLPGLVKISKSVLL